MVCVFFLFFLFFQIDLRGETEKLTFCLTFNPNVIEEKFYATQIKPSKHNNSIEKVKRRDIFFVSINQYKRNSSPLE